jgi:hypothetical protein
MARKKLPAWVRQQRLEHSRARWREAKRKAGLCRRCGKNRPVHPPDCDDCRERHRRLQRVLYRKAKRARAHAQLPSKKLEQSLVVLGRRQSWTLREFAAARWPDAVARAEAGGRGGQIYGVAGKALKRLLAIGLLQQQEPGGRLTLTARAREVLRDEVRGR